MKKKCIIASFIFLIFAISLSLYSYNYATENVHLGKYKGLETEKISYTVEDGDIQTSLETFAKKHLTITKSYKGTVQDGETVNIQYVAKYNGETIKSASGIDDVDLDNQDFGFEEKIVGMNVGETSDIMVVYSDNYEKNEELKGKQIVYTITVNYRNVKTTPEITDELIKKYTDCKTVEEYKNKLKKVFIQDYEKNAEEKAGNILIRKIITNSRVKDYPEEKVETYKKNIDAYYKDAAEQMGITFEALLTYMDMSEEDYEKDLDNEANFYVSKMLIVNEIAKKQHITLSDSEYETYLENISNSFQDFNSLDEVQDYANENKTEEDLRNDALAEKVIQYLLKHNNVKITEKTIDYVSANVEIE